MQSVLTSSTPDHYQARRHLKLTDRNPIPLRYSKVLALHLAGKPVIGEGGICEETGYAPATVYRILSDDRVVQIRQQLLAHTQTEFEALYPAVVASLRKDILSGQPDRENRARDQWLRAAGKYSQDNKPSQINVTAEDVVFQILNQAPSE